MSCNTKTSLAAVIDAVNAQLNNNYVDRDDPRIDQGVFTEPTIRGGLMLDEAAKLDFCGYVTECGQREPFGKQWVDRPLYPHNTLVSYEDEGEIKSRWQDTDDVVAGTEIGESYTTYEETRSLGLQGYTIIDSFELGATITQRNQALRHAETGKLYRWAGDLPKIAPAGSTPTNSGGVGTNAWLEVSDTALRQEIITGGLITDTIVTVTPNGVDTVARNQREVNSDYISVLSYHLPSVNPTHTEAFNKAIAAVSALGGGVINIPRGVYDIDPAIGINLKSNIELRGGVGVKIRNTAHSLTRYRMLNIRDVENVVVSGIELDGNRANNSAVGGEHGMGVCVISSSNVVVRDVVSRNCWGDGFYVGRASDAYDIPSNVLFENVHAFNNRRQGLSVTSVKDLAVNDSSFNTSIGTSPECGIDFEPDNESDELSGIVFNNVTTSGNKSGGLLIYLTKLTENSPRVDITINGYKSDSDKIGLSLGYQAVSKAQGEITINNAKIYRASLYPIVSPAFPDDSIDVQINNPIVIDAFKARGSSSEYNSAVTLGRGSTDWSAIAPNHTDDGGITITNLKVVDTRSTSLTGHLVFIYNNFGSTAGFKIVDPRPAINLYAVPIFIKKGAEVVDRNNNISSSNTLTTSDKEIQAASYTYIDNGATASAARQLNVVISPTATDQNWVKEIVHTGTAGKIYVNLTSSGGVITPKKQVETGVGTGVFAPQEATKISSTVTGSRLRYKIMKNGDMRIIEEVGTWVRA